MPMRKNNLTILEKLNSIKSYFDDNFLSFARNCSRKIMKGNNNMRKIENIIMVAAIAFSLNFSAYASYDQEYDLQRPRFGIIKTMVVGLGLFLSPVPAESVPWPGALLRPSSPSIRVQKTLEPTCPPNPNFKPWTDRQGYVHTQPIQPITGPCPTYAPTPAPSITSRNIHEERDTVIPTKRPTKIILNGGQDGRISTDGLR